METNGTNATSREAGTQVQPLHPLCPQEHMSCCEHTARRAEPAPSSCFWRVTGLRVLHKAQKIKWRHCLRSQSASSRNHTETLSKNSTSRRELGNLGSRPGKDVCLGIVVEALWAFVLGCKVSSCPGWSPRFLWALKIVCVILLPSSSERYRGVWLRLLLSWWRATGCMSATPQ